tara:strand:+ start:480 stop:974 length:495 start_codon:yes stop_codon:yes gene_type:complete
LINLNEIKNKIFKKENFYFLIIILLTFGIDRYSKIEIMNNFSEKTFYINDFINFNLIWNTGIGFGLLNTQSSLLYNFISFVICCVIITLIYIALKSDFIDRNIFAFIAGGAIGNFYDRMIFKAVPDFIDLHYENFHWFTFNVADIFITVGIILYLIKGYFTEKT